MQDSTRLVLLQKINTHQKTQFEDISLKYFLKLVYFGELPPNETQMKPRGCVNRENLP